MRHAVVKKFECNCISLYSASIIYAGSAISQLMQETNKDEVGTSIQWVQ